MKDDAFFSIKGQLEVGKTPCSLSDRMAKRGSFVGVVCAGKRVVTEGGSVFDGWTVGGVRVLPGYHAERQVSLKEAELCTVSLRVAMDRDEKPAFSCACVCQHKSHAPVQHGDSP